VFPLNLYARVRTFLCINCTRDRGCSAHPVFPAPFSWRGKRNCKPRAQKLSREREGLRMWRILRDGAGAPPQDDGRMVRRRQRVRAQSARRLAIPVAAPGVMGSCAPCAIAH